MYPLRIASPRCWAITCLMHMIYTNKLAGDRHSPSTAPQTRLPLFLGHGPPPHGQTRQHTRASTRVLPTRRASAPRGSCHSWAHRCPRLAWNRPSLCSFCPHNARLRHCAGTSQTSPAARRQQPEPPPAAAGSRSPAHRPTAPPGEGGGHGGKEREGITGHGHSHGGGGSAATD